MNWLKKCLYLFVPLFLWLVSFSSVQAANQTDEDDVTLAPYFLLEGTGASLDSFPLKETDVLVNINGIIAETYVTQLYSNEGDAPINATYVFPASTRVSVHGMTMEIGDERITATIKEKEEARQEYEQAKSEGKSASLLEQQRPNVFTMDVANILPGDTVRIELHYTELIDTIDGVCQFVFPTVAGPRYASPTVPTSMKTDRWIASPFLRNGVEPAEKYNITVNLSPGVPISDLVSDSHEIAISWNTKDSAQITLANPQEYAGNRDFLLSYRLTGEDMNCGLILTPGKDENFFLLTVQPPERFDVAAIPSREYIFVLDVSGSMDGYPLETAKELIRNLVTGLRETDRFNVILFADETIPMATISLPATQDDVQRAISFIDMQCGGGGTQLAPALNTALSLPVQENTARSVITITDGYLSGEKEIFEIIRENLNTTNFFSFEIGSSVNRYLIEGIAKAGLGESFVVTDCLEASATAARFRSYIESPILTDIQVSWQGFDVYDVEPVNLPTLFASRPITLFGKWRGEPSGSIRITGMTGNGPYVREIPVSGATICPDDQSIRYLWARKRVERLTDYGCSDTDPSVKQQVTSLGLKYTMMTPYTSFVAVTETIRNKTGLADDVKQPLPLPKNVSELAVGEGYTVGSEPDGLLLLALILLVAFLRIRANDRKKVRRLG